MNKFRIRDLEIFLEASNATSFTECASKLSISQPAVTDSIIRLEKDLGVKLFYRCKTGISLTVEGRARVAKTQDLLQRYENFSNNDESELENKIFNIGCHPTIGSYVLPSVFKNFSKGAFLAKIHLVHGSSRDIQTKVQEGVIDLALVVNPLPVPDIRMIKLFDDVVGVYKPKGRFDLSRLLLNKEMPQSSFILKKWKRFPNCWTNSNNLELLARLVESGLGYGILPERVVKLVAPSLIHCSEFPTFKDEIYLLHRPEFGKTSVERDFIRLFTKSVNTLQTKLY